MEVSGHAHQDRVLRALKLPSSRFQSGSPHQGGVPGRRGRARRIQRRCVRGQPRRPPDLLEEAHRPPPDLGKRSATRSAERHATPVHDSGSEIMHRPIRRIAINTGGGDAPGLNAVIRAAVLSADQPRLGGASASAAATTGLLGDETLVQLDRESVRGITHLGGTHPRHHQPRQPVELAGRRCRTARSTTSTARTRSSPTSSASASTR